MAGVLTRDDPVDQALRRWAREPFEYGVSDCALSVFRYIAEGWGQSGPIARWAGRYRDEVGAKSILRGRGGPLRAFQDEMASVRARRTKAPQRGAVGLIRDSEGQLVAALCTGGGWWAARTRLGFAAFRAEALIAYDAPAGRAG